MHIFVSKATQIIQTVLIVLITYWTTTATAVRVSGICDVM